MSALPTPRSGYSEHNHSGEKPGLALPAANFSPTPQGNPFHSKGSRILGCQLEMGVGVGAPAFWTSPCQQVMEIAPLGLSLPTCKRRLSKRQASLCLRAW